MTDLARERQNARFDIEMPSLRGKVALVTGATDGIGKAIAFRLLHAGARVILPGRNVEKTQRVAASLRGLVPDAQVDARSLDLASPESVANLIRVLSAEDAPIHLLMLNAGVMLAKSTTRPIASNGEELHWQTNYLGHRHLTEGILPLLSAGNARIVAQLSLAARFAKLPPPITRRNYRPMSHYGASKLALAAYMGTLQQRSRDEKLGVTTALCHPGFAKTNIVDGPQTALEHIRSRAVTRAQLLSTSYEAALPALLASIAAWAPGSMAVPDNFLGTSGPPIITRQFRSIDRAAAISVYGGVPATSRPRNSV